MLQFARVINRYDFIDTIVRHADVTRFQMMACTLQASSNIESPDYRGARIPHAVIPERSRIGQVLCAVRLARLLRQWRIDLLHAHHYDESLIGLVATRLHSATALVIGRHYHDALYRLSSATKKRLLLAAEGLANKAARRIIVPSRAIADLLTTTQHVPAEKVDTIPYAIDPLKYSGMPLQDTRLLRAQLAPGAPLILGTFGRLHEEKGHRFLLDGLARAGNRLTAYVLLVVGDGPERGALTAQASGLGLADRVVFLGWRRDALSIMAAVDVVVQPTLHEAFSQVMVEALWLRRALVITNVSGVADLVRSGENGLVVPRGDPTALVDALARVTADSQLRRRLGKAGHELVEKSLTAMSVVPRFEWAYALALGQPS